jgi:hypothetical protein
VRKRSRYRRKHRVLWDGSYKPYYEFTFLDDYIDKTITGEEFTSRWWAFLDEVDAVVS